MPKNLKRYLKPGVWTPLIPFPFRAIIMLAWAILPIPYGIDYLYENPDRQNRLSFIEGAVPLYAWGAVMLLGGLVATVSLLMRWRMRTIVSLHLLGALWFTLSIGLFIDSITIWGGDGFRSGCLFLAVSSTYWMAAIGYYVQEGDGSFEPMFLIEKEGK